MLAVDEKPSAVALFGRGVRPLPVQASMSFLPSAFPLCQGPMGAGSRDTSVLPRSTAAESQNLQTEEDQRRRWSENPGSSQASRPRWRSGGRHQTVRQELARFRPWRRAVAPRARRQGPGLPCPQGLCAGNGTVPTPGGCCFMLTWANVRSVPAASSRARAGLQSLRSTQRRGGQCRRVHRCGHGPFQGYGPWLCCNHARIEGWPWYIREACRTAGRKDSVNPFTGEALIKGVSISTHVRRAAGRTAKGKPASETSSTTSLNRRLLRAP